ncbi:hypothetical protein BJV78DRAFT_1226657 [Lactifluus subvellereus]|nr:hypothetical protein BJV78DRAFT_1226657 [Lactifluus subvellereus]
MAGKNVIRVALRGGSILTNPHWNKGTAFTMKERKQFGLVGRLPYQVNTLDEQCRRAYDQLLSRNTPLRKNSFLRSLKEQNSVLFYQFLRRHLKELLPIVYTPTEADAIANYSHLFRRSEGLYLTFDNQHSMEADFLEQTRGRDIDLVVCSDAESILGIGDQGVGGIGISTAKSVLYTLLAGINPVKSLPVVLDVGTDNETLLDDPLYVGWRHNRVRGDAYDRFTDKFVQLVRKYLPHSLLHFEDFGVTNAQRLLELYRDKHAVFNDDVQGTGAVTLAGIMSAVGVTKSTLADQRYIIYGAGSAGLGIAHQLRDGIVQIDGVPTDNANKQFYLIDKHGLIKQSLGNLIRPALQEFVRPDEEWKGVPTNNNGEISLLEVVKKIKPTVLIGCSTQGGAFTEEVVREMAKGVDRPIIFPLSNPGRLAEVDPAKANDWTNGKALLATGSPFPPAKMPNGKDYITAECNNALIYPGLGFGAVLAKARLLSDSMILAGAQRLASLSPALKDPDDALLPDFADAPCVNFEIAVAVAEQAIAEGIANVDWDDQQVRKRAKELQWLPVYEEYVYDENGET